MPRGGAPGFAGSLPRTDLHAAETESLLHLSRRFEIGSRPECGPGERGEPGYHPYPTYQTENTDERGEQERRCEVLGAFDQQTGQTALPTGIHICAPFSAFGLVFAPEGRDSNFE